MVLVDTFVPEDPANLIDLVEAADYQALQVKLSGDAQVELLVQGVVVGDERLGVGAAGHGDQYWSVHLQESLVVQEPADAADYLTAQDKHGHDLVLVGDQVQVALPVTSLNVSEAVPFLRQGAHALGRHGQL